MSHLELIEIATLLADVIDEDEEQIEPTITMEDLK